ncbi:MAG: putative quinol monooxygenase [Myxococcota bacterium]
MKARTLAPLILGVLLAACGAQSSQGDESSRVNEPERSSMMVIRVVVEVKPEQRDPFVAHLAEEARAVRELDGCERYELFQDPANTNRFLLYEEWASPAAFASYQESDLLRESFAVLGPMMAGPPDSEYFQAQPTRNP